MFRLAMLTDFCYVNHPLVLFDRSPVEDRHVGASKAWNDMEFFLRDGQLRLEGLMRLTEDRQPAIHNLIRRQLGSIHSGWVNCYLEAGQIGKARSAALKAAQMDFKFAFMTKWLLTWINPALALRIVRTREAKRASTFTV